MLCDRPVGSLPIYPLGESDREPPHAGHSLISQIKALSSHEMNPCSRLSSCKR